MTLHALDHALACFSEIDTETFSAESNKIAYLEQMLRLQAPRHLSSTQLSGRRLLLDLLRLLSQLPESGQTAQETQVGQAGTRFRTLTFLLARTAYADLAEKVASSEGVHDLAPQDFVALVRWMDSHGLSGRELALIQPNFFRGTAESQATTHQGIHPQFASLMETQPRHRYDYLAQAFLSSAEPLRLVPRQPSKSVTGRGEALASLFDTPHDPEAASKARLKAFFIPNRHGEPMLALSFLPEH